MDRRTLVAVALCLVVLLAYPFLLKLFGLDRYLQAPSPRRTTTAVDSTRAAHDTTGGSAALVPPSTPLRTAAPADAPPVLARIESGPPLLEQAIHLETPLYRAEFSSRGARLISVELKHYASAHGQSAAVRGKRHRKHGEPLPAEDRVVLAGGPSLGLDLGSGANRKSLAGVIYDVEDSLDAAGEPRALTFSIRDSSGLTVRQTYRIRPDDYAIDLEVEVRNVPLDWRLTDYSLTARSWPLFDEQDPTEEERSLRATSLVGTNLHREQVGGLKKGPRGFDGNPLWIAVHTRYFMGAIAVIEAPAKSVVSETEPRHLTPEQQRLLPPPGRGEQDVAINSLVLSLPGETNPIHRFTVYFGPSEYFRLAKLGMGRAVDLGWNWILPFSKALLRLMVWLNGLVHNYGLAIILLATLVRVVMHPLSMMSMKSMRAMQRLQPEMERIREKYKKDPQAMNAAVMALYKEHKVNPAGGCLPMLLQMPLFIALYSVLFNAIELRQAPFAGWIGDLSAPDLLMSVGPFPVRLLPILMAGSGLLSQKLTPTDPRQASTMYLMNVVMVVFFYNLPSGLVLYWTVMNLLTALQQWLVLREDGHDTRPVAVGGVAVARKAARK